MEAGLTCGLLLVIFGMLSEERLTQWTPIAVTGALSALIWAGAPVTGASMNPARTFGPDAVLTGGHRRTLTAKLFHDSRYPTVHRSELPAAPHPARGTVYCA